MTTEGISRRGRLTEQLALLSVVGAGFLVQGMATISGVLSARLLGVGGRGEIAFVVALAYMASQLTLGGSLSNTITKRLADRGVTARDGLRHLVGRWLVLGTLCALGFGAFFVFINRDNVSPHVLLLGGAVVVLSVQNMAQRIVTSSMLGEDSPKIRIATAALAPQALTTVAILVIFLMYDEVSAVGVAAVMIVSSAIGITGSLFLLAKPTREPDAALDRKDLWALTRSTYFGSVGPIDGLNLDRTLVGTFMSSAQLGVYSAATALANLTSMLGTGLAIVLLPRIASARRDPVAERQLVRRWLLLSAIVLGLLTAATMAISSPVIRFAFGEEFAPAIAVTYWLLPACGLLGFRRILIAILQGRECGGRASLIEFTLTPVMIVGVLVASLLDNIVGVGVAMLLVAALSVSALGLAVARSAPGSASRRPRHLGSSD